MLSEKSKEPIPEYERYKDARGRNRVWVDCNCGWFHAARNKTHAEKLGMQHKEEEAAKNGSTCCN